MATCSGHLYDFNNTRQCSRKQWLQKVPKCARRGLCATGPRRSVPRHRMPRFCAPSHAAADAGLFSLWWSATPQFHCSPSMGAPCRKRHVLGMLEIEAGFMFSLMREKHLACGRYEISQDVIGPRRRRLFVLTTETAGVDGTVGRPLTATTATSMRWTGDSAGRQG